MIVSDLFSLSENNFSLVEEIVRTFPYVVIESPFFFLAEKNFFLLEEIGSHLVLVVEIVMTFHLVAEIWSHLF